MIVIQFALKPGAQMPQQALDGDAGYDLATHHDTQTYAGEENRIPTGIHVQLPPGYWGLIHTRSSTRKRWGLAVRTTVIDEGYRGELYIGYAATASNLIPGGTRLAQLIPIPRPAMVAIQRDRLDVHERGVAGYGSTGC